MCIRDRHAAERHRLRPEDSRHSARRTNNGDSTRRGAEDYRRRPHMYLARVCNAVATTARTARYERQLGCNFVTTSWQTGWYNGVPVSLFAALWAANKMLNFVQKLLTQSAFCNFIQYFFVLLQRNVQNAMPTLQINYYWYRIYYNSMTIFLKEWYTHSI